jgi:serine/threonine protein kinase
MAKTIQSQQSGGRSHSPDAINVKCPSPDEKAFRNIQEQYSSFDIRKVYKFEKMIGGGHFGTVRLAHRIKVPTIKYAVKSILRQNISKDVRLLEEELEILRQVDHPNIIKFHESYIDYRYIHIVMELATGGELFDKII